MCPLCLETVVRGAVVFECTRCTNVMHMRCQRDLEANNYLACIICTVGTMGQNPTESLLSYAFVAVLWIACEWAVAKYRDMTH